jgi:hypothetical protein
MAKRTDRARVILDLSGTTPSIEDSENVSAISEVDSEHLFVHFGTPFPDALFRCDVIPSEPAGYDIRARSKAGVGIHLDAPWPQKLKIVCEAI